MNVISYDDKAARLDLRIARFFAVILYGFALFIGLPAVLGALGSLRVGEWRSFAMLGGAGLLAWMLFWLGRVLWTGRSIPGWFLNGFFLSILAIGTVPSLLEGKWMDALIVAGMIVPSGLSFWNAQAQSTKKPPKRDEFDEIA